MAAPVDLEEQKKAILPFMQVCTCCKQCWLIRGLLACRGA